MLIYILIIFAQERRQTYDTDEKIKQKQDKLTSIIQDFIDMLIALQNNTTIIETSLSGWNIDGNKFICDALADMLQYNKTLEKFTMEYSSLTNDGLIIISNSLRKNNTLKYLNLGGNQLDDGGILSLVDVIKVNTSLTHLLIDNNYPSSCLIDIANSLEFNNSILVFSFYNFRNNLPNNFLTDIVPVFNNSLEINNTLLYCSYVNYESTYFARNKKLWLNTYWTPTIHDSFDNSFNEMIITLLLCTIKNLPSYRIISNCLNNIKRYQVIKSYEFPLYELE